MDVATFRPGARDPELRAMLGIARDARLLVFAGRLSPEKHAGDLVTSITLLGDPYHLLLIGGGRFTPRAPNVTVLGYQQDNRQLARLLASCDAFVHAARRRAETHGWDAAFARLLGRYTRLMGRPATLGQRIRDVR